MYPEMLFDTEKPKDPVTLDLYPSGKSAFSLYEDDGATQNYRNGAFARTPIEMEAPVALDTPGEAVTVKIGAAKGQYDGMPASRAWALDVHLPAKPAGVTMGGRALGGFEAATQDRAARDKARADFTAATEGWYFDAADRRGVLHVKIAPQRLATGFVVTIKLP
jgi:hypothetical protein